MLLLKHFRNMYVELIEFKALDMFGSDAGSRLIQVELPTENYLAAVLKLGCRIRIW